MATGDLVVRLLESHEMMRLIGWEPLAFYRPMQHSCASDYHFAQLIFNMCGNAWSVFQYAPIVIALMATAGKYWGAPETVDL
eukprot:2252701-Karenia_brevis.AAC.1